LEALPPSPELAWAYSNRAQLQMLVVETNDAVHWGSRAIELAQQFGATEPLVHALNNVGFAQLLANDQQGRAKLEESPSSTAPGEIVSELVAGTHKKLRPRHRGLSSESFKE
jgi:hypothetical protein